jgi:hypothetical protein
VTSAGRRRRRLVWSVVCIVVGVGAVCAALLYRDLRRAETALTAARASAPSFAEALRQGDEAKARQLLSTVRERTTTARTATDGPLWAVAAHLPWAGRTFATTRAVSRVSDGMVGGVGAPLLDALQEVRGAHQRAGGRVDLATVTRVKPQLQAALRRTEAERQELRRSPRAWVWPRVGRAREELLERIDEMSGVLGTLADGADVLPGMLGADGPRTYLLAFQNNAEARGTGGLLGGFGLLRVDHGRATVLHVGSDRELDRLPAPTLDLGPDFRRLYGHDLSAWQNANMTGHFPSAARLWLDMWQRFTGQRLDGVLATDPTALARLLAVTGPVTVPGAEPFTADNVVARTESLAYQSFDGDDVARKGFLVEVGQRVLSTLLGPRGPGLTDLVRPLLDAAEQRSAMVYSTRPAEEAWLAGTPLGGEVPDEGGPFLFMTVNNTAGNKIDYYLERRVQYDLAPCAGGRRTSTVTTTLRTDIPETPLPPVVVGRIDRDDRPARSTGLLVSWYVAQGARVVAAEVDGKPVRLFLGREQGHPVVTARLELLARRQRVVRLTLSEPASPAAPVVLEQSLARPQTTLVQDARCG